MFDKLPSATAVEPRSTTRRQGLRKLSPDLISKARDETTTQVTRIGLTFVGTTAFCLLSLLTPDSALLGGSERISVPFVGPVSFAGFMVLGPALLSDANLSRADLWLAKLSNAKLSNADLSGANLSRAVGLTQTQLNDACGNADTKLPEGLTIKQCAIK
jgi:hypothetical protein